jgi:osmoprotectant transport system ATP-binding protein
MEDSSAPAIELIDADIPRARSVTPTAVLHNVRWKIARGDFWALGAGPGTGKTDLLCTAAALQRPLKGFHLIFGQDTREMDEHELVASHQKVAMIFDSGRLFPHLTVAGNLALPLAYHLGASGQEIAGRVDEILEVTGLLDVRDRLPNQMTRNLHQRAGLARALALHPEVLLIDSPLGGIDPRQRRWWLDFLCQLNQGHPAFGKRKITVVVGADDLIPWRDTAARFAVISERKLRIVGGREEVRAARDSAVQELLTSDFEAG